jgi:TldD protein
MMPLWPRRRWLQCQGVTVAAFAAWPGWLAKGRTGQTGWFDGAPRRPSRPVTHRAHRASYTECFDPAPWHALAQQAVEASRTAGARYAEARLTRIVQHHYTVDGQFESGGFGWDATERVGISVRALVDGYWGFAASAVPAPDEALRLAHDAVTHAKAAAHGPPWTVELGTIPVATGTWVTPHRIDPFAISIEEKLDYIAYWRRCAVQAGVGLVKNGMPSELRFARQERVVATSEGALFTQTLLESGGLLLCGDNTTSTQVDGIELAGAGWERLLDAKIPDQFPRIRAELAAMAAIPAKPSVIGQYTLVCDGATMAALLEATLGVATQLDRALGYEADAGGTSFITDPLAMVGHAQVASPVVTVTANRSAPQELATVQWDDEGVTPQPFTLIKDGVLVDFQTTREQAAWLAPYYHAHGRPVVSHGCAAAEDAHGITQQMLPNLALLPSPAAIRLDDLVADVQEGILIEGGTVSQVDAQARTGLLLGGRMRQIRNGRAGAWLMGGAVLFRSQDLWKHITAVGNASTQGGISRTQYTGVEAMFENLLVHGKGQPPQFTSHSVRAVAATIPKQSLIDPLRKA